MDHVLHEDWAFSFQHLQDVQVDRKEGSVQDMQESLMAPASEFRLLKEAEGWRNDA